MRVYVCVFAGANCICCDYALCSCCQLASFGGEGWFCLVRSLPTGVSFPWSYVRPFLLFVVLLVLFRASGMMFVFLFFAPACTVFPSQICGIIFHCVFGSFFVMAKLPGPVPALGWWEKKAFVQDFLVVLRVRNKQTEEVELGEKNLAGNRAASRAKQGREGGGN